MADTGKTNPIRVRLGVDLKSRLDQYCAEQHRDLTNAVNLLLDEALSAYELSINAGYRKKHPHPGITQPRGQFLPLPPGQE